MTAFRKLAAILAADVVGYSRMMGEDEAGTASLVAERREAVLPIIAAHGGRLFKTMGDGMLVEFASVVAAVECALAMQKQMAARNEGALETQRILYRIGVHLGDVLVEGQDILGEGVNIASRLESVAEPGGVCISGAALRACAWADRGGVLRPRGEGAQEYRPAGACLCCRRQAPHPPGVRLIRRPPKLARLASRSSCFRSPISAATRSRTISSTA